MTGSAELRGVRYAYPGAGAPTLDGVDLSVEPGEVVLLAGPSGGGKSTILRVLGGLVPHFHGGIVRGAGHAAGLDLARARPAEIASRVGVLFQEPETQGIFSRVVRDVAFSLQTRGFEAARIVPRAEAALAEVGAAHLAGRRLEELSSGERQRAALAAVLAAGPALLLLDEPTSQLDDEGADRLASILRAVADRGAAVIVSEHRIDRIAPIADRVLSVSGGRVAAGHPDDGPPAAAVPGSPGALALSATGLVAERGGRTVLAGADLEVRRGEAVALVGPNGSGKTTLMRLLAGLDRAGAGRIEVAGHDLAGIPPEQRFPTLALLPQDPGRHLLCERADDEVGLGLTTLGMPREEARARGAALLRELGLPDAGPRHPRDLSVGERERVALGAALAADPLVLLLDEPTRGMDPGRRAQLAAIVRARVAGGAAALVATHDRAFAAAACDRTVALRDGRAHPEPVPGAAEAGAVA
jgi:energy-coupling factor transporter ATP-binding protein EcfA2